MNEKEYTHAYQLFNNIDYKDSSERAQECLNLYLDESYTEAMSLFNAGKYEEALNRFIILSLYGYKDSEAKTEECNNAIYGEEVWDKIKNTNVGDIIKFGKYEQDNDLTNGKEDIEWQVLYKDGTKVLVISKQILDWQQYHTSDTDVTWETSSLRQWLNSTFLNDAFSSAEQAKIPTATVTADKNPKKDTNPGNATQDRIFLLSYEEAEKYFDSEDARICLPTDYASANGAYTGEAYGSNGSVWWLRTPGESQKEATWVFWDGDTNYLGQNATFNMGIRPVMWIDLREIS